MARDRQSLGAGDPPGRRGFLAARSVAAYGVDCRDATLGQQPVHGQADGTRAPHWNYEGAAGAGHWGELAAS